MRSTMPASIRVLTDRADRVLGQQPDFVPPGFRPAPISSCCSAHAQARRASCLPDTVKITYTSGSTGTPKGVCLAATTLLAVSESLAAAVSAAPA